MNKDRAKAKFLGEAEAVFDKMWEWGEEHPQATLDEMAAELAPLRQELLGELLGEVGHQHGDGRYEEVVCPDCGEKMESSGRRRRTVNHAEEEVKIKRAYRRCPECGQGISPLDQRLHLTARSWTPATIVQALRMSIEISSYARAAAQFSELTHVILSQSSLHELVNEYGGHLVERHAEEAQATVAMPSEETEEVWREIPEPPSKVMNISMDGAMVNIRNEGWKEVKLVTASAVCHLIDAVTGNLTTHLDDHSYRAGLWDATAFGQQQWAEACGRGVEKANYLSSVNDGAAWIWNIVRMCYGNCVEIIDWWHAVAKLWLIAQHHFDAESEQATEWVSAQKQLLIEGGLGPCPAQHPPTLPQRTRPV